MVRRTVDYSGATSASPRNSSVADAQYIESVVGSVFDAVKDKHITLPAEINDVEENDPIKVVIEAKELEEEAALAKAPPRTTTGTADVEITWVRHGLACHNANDKYVMPDHENANLLFRARNRVRWLTAKA